MNILEPQGEHGRLVSPWGEFNRPAVHTPDGLFWMQSREGQWYEMPPAADGSGCEFLPDPTERRAS